MFLILMLQPQTALTSGVDICREDEVYSPSDITAKPYYLKRNYQDLQTVKTLVYMLQYIIHSEYIFTIIIWHYPYIILKVT